MKRSLILFLLVSITHLGYAQCPQILRQARTVYDEGRIQELPSLLASCIESGFTKEERTEAYRLLILSYIYLDEPDKADDTMLALLKDNPEFQINEASDPAELINLYGTFRTKPIFMWGAKLDITYTFVNVINSYATYDQTTTFGEYTPEIGIGGSIVVEKEFKNRLTGRFEASLTTHKFTYTSTFLNTPNDPLGIVTPELIETQTWLGGSLLGQYEFLKRSSWKPYVTIGPSIYYMISDDLSAETAVDGGEQATGTSLDLVEKEMRTKINLMVSAGLGIKKKFGTLYFIANARYSYGLVNITEKHFNNELTLKYGAALNDISTGIATFSVGILLPQFSPKKLTN